MDYRTYGQTKNCKGCYYWSEMLAKCDSGTPGVVAMCLNKKSTENGKYKAGYQKCENWKTGAEGVVDAPGGGLICF